MPKVSGEKDTRDADFAAQLEKWEARVNALNDGKRDYRNLRAKLLLESDEGNQARLSYRTITIGGKFEHEMGTPVDMRESARKAQLESEAENLIALTMPLYDQPRRSKAMEDLRQEIKEGFAQWLLDSGHPTWAYGLDRGQELSYMQTLLAIQKMCDDFADVLQSSNFIDKMETALQDRASSAVAAQ